MSSASPSLGLLGFFIKLDEVLMIDGKPSITTKTTQSALGIDAARLDKTADELVLDVLLHMKMEKKPYHMLFYDPTFLFAIPPDVKPLRLFPSLVNPKMMYAEKMESGDVAQIQLVLPDSELCRSIQIRFSHYRDAYPPCVFTFPIKSKPGTHVLIDDMASIGPEYTGKAVIGEILSEMKGIDENSVVLKYVVNGSATVLLPFQKFSDILVDIFTRNAYNDGRFLIAVKRERITWGMATSRSSVSLGSINFTDSQRARDSFLGALSPEMVVPLAGMESELMHELSSKPLTELLPTVISKLCNVLVDRDPEGRGLRQLGVKYVLSFVLLSVLAPFMESVTGQPRFLRQALHNCMGVKMRLAAKDDLTEMTKLWKMDHRNIVWMSLSTFLVTQNKLVETIVDTTYKLACRLKEESGHVSTKHIPGSVLMRSRVIIAEKGYLLIMTLGFIYIVDVDKANEGEGTADVLLPDTCPVQTPDVVVCSLPINCWMLLPIADPGEAFGFLTNGSDVSMTVRFKNPSDLMIMYIVFCFCKNVLRDNRIIPRSPERTRIDIACMESGIQADVVVGDYSWRVALPATAIIEHSKQMAGVYVRPSIEKAKEVSMLHCPRGVRICGRQMENKVIVGQLKLASPSGVDKDMDFATSLAHAIVFDLMHSQFHLFAISVLFRTADFSYAVGMSCPDLMEMQLNRFGERADEFLVQSVPLLHFTALSGNNPLILRQVCRYCSDLNRKDNTITNRNAVFYAIRNPNLSMLQTLLEYDQNGRKIDVNHVDMRGISPLQYCIANDLGRRVVDILLENGAMAHYTPIQGASSPLMYTIRQNATEMMKVLLAYAGPYINTPDADGKFIAHVCIDANGVGYLPIIQRVCQQWCPNLYTDVHPVHYALQRENRDTLISGVLLLSKLDLNVINKNGETPLTKAVINNWQNIVRALVSDIRCDVNAYDSLGKSPLSYAVRDRNIGFVDILTRQGAIADQPNADGESPLFIAVRNEDTTAQQLLRAKGASNDRWYFNAVLPIHILDKTSTEYPEVQKELDKLEQMICHT